MSSVAHAPPSSGRRIPRRLIVAAILVVPATIFVGANVLQYGLGLDGAAAWLDPAFDVPVLGNLLVVVIVGGPLVAFLLALSWLVPIQLVPDGDAYQVKVRIRLDPLAIGIAAVSLGVGGILAGHLVAENLACVIGVASRC
jgi:hypothetical protein